MAEGKEGGRTAALHCGSQEPPGSLRGVGKNVWRRGSAACSEPTRSEIVRVEAFLDGQRVTRGGMGYGEVVKGKKFVEAVAPWRGSERSLESMHVLKRSSGKRRETRVKQLDDEAVMKARENDINFEPRMVEVEKLRSVKKRLKKMKKSHCSLMVSLQLTEKELIRMKRDSREKGFLIESIR